MLGLGSSYGRIYKRENELFYEHMDNVWAEVTLDQNQAAIVVIIPEIFKENNSRDITDLIVGLRIIIREKRKDPCSNEHYRIPKHYIDETLEVFLKSFKDY